jgi:hypothetical protein
MLYTLSDSLESDSQKEAEYYAQKTAMTYEYLEEKFEGALSKDQLVQLTVAASNFAISNSTIMQADIMQACMKNNNKNLSDISTSLDDISVSIDHLSGSVDGISDALGGSAEDEDYDEAPAEAEAEAEAEGYDAFHEGVPLKNNPYTEEEEGGYKYLWDKGWNQARTDDEEDD